MADESNFAQGKLKVRLVTPERILVDTDASSVSLPAAAGVMEALPGAAPLLTAVGAGELVLAGAEGGDQRFIVARGFAEILPDRVTVLAEYAERPEEVDKAAAEQLLKEGEKQLAEAGDDPEKNDSARRTIVEADARLGRANG